MFTRKQPYVLCILLVICAFAVHDSAATPPVYPPTEQVAEFGEVGSGGNSILENYAVLVYYSGEAELESIYESTLQGLSENPNLLVFETSDEVEFSDNLGSGEYPVMIALSTNQKKLNSWLLARHPIPTLAVCTPSDDGSYELTFSFYKVFDSESAGYAPASGENFGNTAPRDYEPGEYPMVDKAMGIPSMAEVWAKIEAFVKDTRQWISEKMRQIAAILRDIGEDLEVSATVHLGEPTGSVWIELTVKGNAGAVARFVDAVGAVIEPTPKPGK